MCVCIHVCMCVYIHICMCTYMYICIHAENKNNVCALSGYLSICQEFIY